jgi:tetratricopeptide (TPR) repeat protein
VYKSHLTGNVPPTSSLIAELLICAAVVAAVGPASHNSHSAQATASAQNSSAAADGAEPLRAGSTVEATLGGGAVRAYGLQLARGTRMRVVIGKDDVALRMSLSDSAGAAVAGLVSRRYGAAELPFTAADGGQYKLEVRSLETDPAERPFRLTFAEWEGEASRHDTAIAAARAVAEAEELRGKWEERPLRRALERYAEAAALWEATGDDDGAARAAAMHVCAGDVHFLLSEYSQAISRYERALSLAERAGAAAARVEVLINLGYVHIYLGDNRAALRYAKQALALLGRLGPRARAEAGARRAEAWALNSLGETHYSLGNLRASLGFFERALKLWSSAGDRRGQALAHINMGYSLSDLGERQQAAEHYREALRRWTAVDDRRGVALAQTALGGVNTFLGESQSALELHGQAASLFRAMGNQQGEAAALNGIAHVYEDLGEPQAALDYYSRALAIYERIGNRDFAALNHLYVGRIYHLLGDATLALRYYGESLRLSHEVGNREMEGHALKGIGTIQASRNEVGPAAEHFDAALRRYRWAGNRRGQAYTLNHIAQLHSAAGRHGEALGCYRRALRLIREAADSRGRAMILFNNSRAERDVGNLDAALVLARESIDTIESLRTKVSNTELRTSYFASVHQHYELYIDLLMSLHRRQPGGGYAGQALLASERARARTLLESLTEERIDWRGADAELLRREQEVQQRLDGKAEVQMRLLNARRAEEAARVAREIHALTIEHEDVRARIRERAPRYATLTQPDLLRLEDIQRELSDGGTLLLEFALGQRRSYLWAVSADAVEVYELPAAAAVEEAADKVYELLSKRPPPAVGPAPAWDAQYLERAAALSRMLFGQVGGLREAKRLLIVSDGGLQHIPFEALPVPGAAGAPGDGVAGAAGVEPFFLRYEIIGLPSAHVLSALRRDQTRPHDRSKMVAVLADPVFDKDDARVPARAGESAAAAGSSAPEGQTAAKVDGYLERALRNVDLQEPGGGITRLPATLREGRAIVALAPEGGGLLLTGFDASREKVSAEELGEFRILHFATHGIMNNEHPELSGIILSLVDEGGNSRNGFLRLHDIYRLNLSAELVVLSACRTGLGKNVRGEGPVGLMRGFMYAGSKSVVATLWQVDDDATAFFMEHFYTALLRHNATPAAALQSAKREMWRHDTWRQPYFWAAFVLQGDYRERFGASGSARREHAPTPSSRRAAAAAALGALALVAAGWYASRRRGPRRQTP